MTLVCLQVLYFLGAALELRLPIRVLWGPWRISTDAQALVGASRRGGGKLLARSGSNSATAGRQGRGLQWRRLFYQVMGRQLRKVLPGAMADHVLDAAVVWQGGGRPVLQCKVEVVDGDQLEGAHDAH